MGLKGLVTLALLGRLAGSLEPPSWPLPTLQVHPRLSLPSILVPLPLPSFFQAQSSFHTCLWCGEDSPVPEGCPAHGRQDLRGLLTLCPGGPVPALRCHCYWDHCAPVCPEEQERDEESSHHLTEL